MGSISSGQDQIIFDCFLTCRNLPLGGLGSVYFGPDVLQLLTYSGFSAWVSVLRVWAPILHLKP